ncbi:hypothetical protein Y032_0039g40 [Ancylostoma ceylanicum]|uniref:Uncharacterized protein n=1 Tax=Ancylostoma ceylanicum TaxID=53326 RepID=A0A016UI32_9BILA|nr:hypothetical protein Y032_0039g40 [Ancylostoma ceylanicum]
MPRVCRRSTRALQFNSVGNVQIQKITAVIKNGRTLHRRVIYMTICDEFLIRAIIKVGSSTLARLPE